MTHGRLGVAFSRPADWLGGLAASILAATWFTLVAANPVPRAEYVFVRESNRHVRIDRGDYSFVGEIDAAGNYLHQCEIPLGSNEIPGTGPINSRTPRRMYEYRSGRLILGTMTPEGYFIPELDAPVIWFGDYHYGPDAIPIWNLPGYFKRNDAVRSGKDGEK